MAGYVDGYVLKVPKRRLGDYRKMAAKAGKIWRQHGALDYKECVGDDYKTPCGAPFSRMAKIKAGETVIFSYILFKSKAHRNKVNGKVLKDPRIQSMCDPKNPPFDMKSMVYSGFKVLVDA